MRINGYGAGFGQGDGPRDRAAAFRARHSIGQRVKGRILRREPNGLYWVQVGGEELLARLEVQAEPGDQLIFIVRALTPEIMLQALAAGQDAADLPGLVQRFRSARETFELGAAGFLSAITSLPPQASLRHEAFLHHLAAQSEAQIRLAKALDLLGQINASVAAERNAKALYLPWLLPGLRRQEMLLRLRPGGGRETALSAAGHGCGLVEARLVQGEAGTKLTLMAEHPELCGTLQVECFALVREELGQEPQMLGPCRLKPSPLGGVLGELFGPAPGWSSGGLNTRV